MYNQRPDTTSTNTLIQAQNMVIARVWKSKDSEGNVVTPLKALQSDGNVGHVSLQIFLGGQQKLYISFWPNETPFLPMSGVSATLHTINQDHYYEGSAPDVISYIVNLDGKKIMDDFFSYLQKNNSKPTYRLYPFSGSSMGSISFSDGNCCTIAFNLVQNACVNLGVGNDIINSQIEGMKKKGNWIDPNLLGEFFKYFSEQEDRVFSELNLSTYKENFIKTINEKILALADKACLGEIYIYKNIFPELYARLSVEVNRRVTKLSNDIAYSLREYADEANTEELDKLKDEYRAVYQSIEKDINERLEKALTKLSAEKTKEINRLREKNKEQAKKSLQVASHSLLQALDQHIKQQPQQNLDINAAQTFSSNILNMLRKENIDKLLNEPESFGIPQSLSSFLFFYLNANPLLILASEYTDEAKEVEVILAQNPSSLFSPSHSDKEVSVFLSSQSAKQIVRDVYNVYQFIKKEMAKISQDQKIDERAASTVISLLDAGRKNSWEMFYDHSFDTDNHSIDIVDKAIMKKAIEKFEFLKTLNQGQNVGVIKELETTINKGGSDALESLYQKVGDSGMSLLEAVSDIHNNLLTEKQTSTFGMGK